MGPVTSPRSKATLSRRVRELETRLGTPLLERGGSRLKLTEDGRLLLDRAVPLLADLDALWADLASRDGPAAYRAVWDDVI